MEEKFFLVQAKRTNGTYSKGVVVHDTLDAARQGFHAYLGAYAYGHEKGTDYVMCAVIGMNGEIWEKPTIDNRIPIDGPEEVDES